jgi:hypothetical protein
VTWCASLAVVLDRCAWDLGRVRRGGLDRFTAAVRRERRLRRGSALAARVSAG